MRHQADQGGLPSLTFASAVGNSRTQTQMTFRSSLHARFRELLHASRHLLHPLEHLPQDGTRELEILKRAILKIIVA